VIGDGAEVDFVLEGLDGGIAAIKVKASASPTPSDARHLRWLKGKLGDRMVACIVLHLGRAAGSFGDGIYALPVSALWDHRPLTPR
jgi:uncharacterized protein